MKIFSLAANENWVVDRFVQEWNESNPALMTTNPHDCDILWLVAGWCWNQVPLDMLRSKKVVLTVHHIVPEKFDQQKIREFIERDYFIDAYHVPCEKTKAQIVSMTNKPIFVIPFWANQNLWFEILGKNEIREKYGIDKNLHLIGSFQRDTEGSDLISPKLEKGPDIFCDKVEKLFSERSDVGVLLAGWRRQYVINRLRSKGIPYYYFDLPSFEVLNELYNCLDLYLITARHEGGPQAIIECALTKTPCISTDVGIATKILSEESIIRGSEKPTSPDVDYAHKKVKELEMPQGFSEFRNMFKKICVSNTDTIPISPTNIKIL